MKQIVMRKRNGRSSFVAFVPSSEVLKNEQIPRRKLFEAIVWQYEAHLLMMGDHHSLLQVSNYMSA
jgi:hypothetical protein